MKVKRIVANVSASAAAVSASAAARAKSFYQDLLGLEALMDMGWIGEEMTRYALLVRDVNGGTKT